MDSLLSGFNLLSNFEFNENLSTKSTLGTNLGSFMYATGVSQDKEIRVKFKITKKQYF